MEGRCSELPEAAKWYRRAAEQGDAYAQSGLGSMYLLGVAVPYDLVQAYKWLNLAASRFEDPEKDIVYGQLFPESQVEARTKFIRSLKEVQRATLKAREAVKRRMTAAQIIEAQKLASAWKPKSEVSIQPADLERWSKIVHDAARKNCGQGDQAACTYLDQKH